MKPATDTGLATEHPAVAGLFSLRLIEEALTDIGWDAGEHVKALLEIAQTGAKPSDRLRAMSDLQAFISKQVELHTGQAKIRREVTRTDEQGNQTTDTLEFTKRWAEGVPASQGIDPDFTRRGNHEEFPDLDA